ncbi:MAG: hypothetical protein EHM28_11990 [Spirochaetaceae bacterium]|nr:MAG: hypothetical protein EHM28_11990 [Spirochaetaceae bacterium]
MGASDVTIYAKWLHYSIGDTGPAGGLVCCDTACYDTKGWRYLEAAPADQSVGKIWSQASIDIAGADSTAMGFGNQNTIDIVTQLGQDVTYAAGICDA